MPSRRIAHLSDLHAGATTDESLQRLVRAVLRSGADHVAITGDVTHRGRGAELERFRRAFEPLLGNGRAVIVPGNHDRLGDDLEAELMPGERVQVSAGQGLWMVRCTRPVRTTGAGGTATGSSGRPMSTRYVDGGRVDTCWIDARRRGSRERAAAHPVEGGVGLAGYRLRRSRSARRRRRFVTRLPAPAPRTPAARPRSARSRNRSRACCPSSSPCAGRRRPARWPPSPGPSRG